MNRPTLQTVTLPNGGTVTPTVELGDGVTAAIGATLVGILLPAALDTPTDLTLEVSPDGSTWSTSLRNDSNNLIGIFSTASPGAAHALNYEIMMPWRYVRIRSSLAQTADRVFTLIQRTPI